MHHYLDANGGLWGFDNALSQEEMTTRGLRVASDAEVSAIQNPAPSLSELIAAKKAAVRAYRDNLLLLTPFNGKVFQSDLQSKLQIIVVASQPSMPPSAAQWRTADNSYMTMTLPLFQQLMGTIMVREGAAFTASAMHQDNIQSLGDASSVAAYDFSGGWPT